MSPERTPAFRMGPTRSRDLVAVGLVATIIGYLLVRLNYGSIPPLPRLAGSAPAILGIAEAIFGHGLRQRIQGQRTQGQGIQGRQDDRRSDLKPVPPLTAARAVMTAKASALAAAALCGLWVGLLAYVLPDSGMITAARSDSVSAGIGLAGAVLMLFGALYLEFCCRAPEDPRDGRAPVR